VSEPPRSGRAGEVLALLRSQPYSFQFFQAVRLLTRLSPGRIPVGEFAPPSREVVRFSAYHATSFPASQVQGAEWPDGGQPRFIINFMGLTGPSGVLPLYYSELIMERLRSKDRAMRDFLDLFNHRMVSLFYRAWEKHRFYVRYERDQQDRFSQYLMDLIGLGTPGLQRRLAVRDESLLFYSGLLSLQPRSATAMEQILSDYFGVPARVEQFVGAWHRLSGVDQCQVGEPFTASEQVAVGAVVGDAVFDPNSGARVVLGPLTFAQYRQFLPDGNAHATLRALVQHFCNNEVDFEVQLVLHREHIPPCVLDTSAEALPQLGWTTWAKTAPAVLDAGDTILRI
jgi:type VI secretion system protein ImpH